MKNNIQLKNITRGIDLSRKLTERCAISNLFAEIIKELTKFKKL